MLQFLLVPVDCIGAESFRRSFRAMVLSRKLVKKDDVAKKQRRGKAASSASSQSSVRSYLEDKSNNSDSVPGSIVELRSVDG